jgi:hypothetical protein
MEAGTRTQLITVGATLSAVVLTLISNAYLERRRAKDAQSLESLRLASERLKWLRDERVKAYAALSTAAEEMLQFIRSDLPTLIERNTNREHADAEARWRELRTDLRKAYNQVVLFGADDARATGLELWKTARNSGNDLLHDLGCHPDNSARPFDMSEQIRVAGSRLGTVGERFLDACRTDLQG